MKTFAASLLATLLCCAALTAFAGPGDKACASKAATATTTASCSRCGDGYCAKQCGETAASCPKDCGTIGVSMAACGKCGDGRCTPQCGETSQSCPKDCGVESTALLGDAGK